MHTNVPGNMAPIPKPHSFNQPNIQNLRRVTEQRLALSQRANILNRHRVVNHRYIEDRASETDPKTDELICRFLVSQGLKFDVVNDKTFQNLMTHLHGSVIFPSTQILEACVERLSSTTKPPINYGKQVGPLTATIDMIRKNEEVYLAFSIHHFQDYSERKNNVFLKKLILCDSDSENIAHALRKSISHLHASNIRFTNVTTASETVSNQLKATNVAVNTYICFYTYITEFVEGIYKMDDFKQGIEQMQTFVNTIKHNPEHYKKFRRGQLSRNQELDLPSCDNSKWTTIAVFITKCILLNDSFVEYSERWKAVSYISQETFGKLLYMLSIISKCMNYCKELSQPASSVSQVIPAIQELKHFLLTRSDSAFCVRELNALFDEQFKSIRMGKDNKRYDIATLLDPRYGYSDLVYNKQLWINVEKKLLEEIANDEADNKDSEDYMAIKNTRLANVKRELTMYQQQVCSMRPDNTCEVFGWWAAREHELTYLSHRAYEYLSAPAITIDAEFLFGVNGKFTHFCRTMNAQQIENAFTVAGQHQPFVGRGNYPDIMQFKKMMGLIHAKNTKRAPLDHHSRMIPRPMIPPGIFGSRTYPRKQNIRTVPVHPPIQMMPNHHPIPLQEQSDEDYISNFLMEPPPEKRVNTQPVRYIDAQGFGEKEVKLEPLDEEEQKPECLTIPNSIMPHRRVNVNKPSTSTAPIRTQNTPLISGTSQHFRNAPNITQKVTMAEMLETRQPPGVRPNIPADKQMQFLPATAAPNRPASPGTTKVTMTLAEALNEVKQEVLEEEEQKPPAVFHQPPTELGYQGVDYGNPGSYPPRTAVPYVAQSRNGLHRAIVPPKPHPYNMEAMRKKACNRRCSVCGKLEKHEALKNVTIEAERLMIYTANVRCDVIKAQEAYERFNKSPKTYICLSHFQEACEQFSAELCISHPEKLYDTPTPVLESYCRTAEQIKGASITVAQIKQFMIGFMRKYSGQKLPPMFPPICRQSEEELEMETMRVAQHALNEYYGEGEEEEEEEEEDDSMAQPAKEPILPKQLRQPRKQVLEKLENDHGATMRVIKKRHWDPIDTPVPTHNEDGEEMKCPEKCVYCQDYKERAEMLRVPKTEERIVKWYEQLGAEFEKRTKSNGDSFICRVHFPAKAFSSRGRLLKGMVPIAPDNLTVAYELKNNIFTPIDEPTPLRQSSRPQTKKRR